MFDHEAIYSRKGHKHTLGNTELGPSSDFSFTLGLPKDFYRELNSPDESQIRFGD